MEQMGNLQKYMVNLVKRYPVLEKNRTDILEAFDLLKKCFRQGNKLLIAGNGGSCADANHIVGELMKGFRCRREIPEGLSGRLREIDVVRGSELASKLQGALPTLALDNHNALNTAFLNDVDGNLIYAQQVMGYGNEGDVFLGISTSGNSENILYAAVTARAKGLKVIGFTGKMGGMLKEFADVCVRVDEEETYKIQELHLPIYHCLCLMLEESFFNSEIERM